MARDYLADFFPLSNDLTTMVAVANSQLVEDEENSISEEDKDEIDPEDLTREARLDPRLGLADHEPGSPLDRIEECRRTIRERLYRYLAFLARSQQAEQEEPYNIFEVLPEALETLLGLENSDERFENLPIVLTSEFRNWLARHDRHYVAAWGEMRLEGESLLWLKAKGFESNGSQRGYSRASYSTGRPHATRHR